MNRRAGLVRWQCPVFQVWEQRFADTCQRHRNGDLPIFKTTKRFTLKNTPKYTKNYQKLHHTIALLNTLPPFLGLNIDMLMKNDERNAKSSAWKGKGSMDPRQCNISNQGCSAQKQIDLDPTQTSTPAWWKAVKRRKNKQPVVLSSFQQEDSRFSTVPTGRLSIRKPIVQIVLCHGDGRKLL